MSATDCGVKGTVTSGGLTFKAGCGEPECCSCFPPDEERERAAAEPDEDEAEEGIVVQRVLGWPIATVEDDPEPRIRDEELGKRLGYARPRDVRKMAERYHAAKILSDFDICATVARSADPLGRGRPATVYYLTEPAALFLAARSETRLAVDLTRQMVEVFAAARRGLLQGGLNLQIGRGYVGRWATEQLFLGKDPARLIYDAQQVVSDAIETEQLLAWRLGDSKRAAGLSVAILAARDARGRCYKVTSLVPRLQALLEPMRALLATGYGFRANQAAKQLGQKPGDAYVVLEYLCHIGEAYPTREVTDGHKPTVVTTYRKPEKPITLDKVKWLYEGLPLELPDGTRLPLPRDLELGEGEEGGGAS